MKQNDAAFSAEHRQYIARLNRSRRGIRLARCGSFLLAWG